MQALGTNYPRMQQLVHGGKFEFINVIGLPRSNGTALHLALTQAIEIAGQLNEPFYYPDLKGRKWNYIPTDEKPVRTFEDGCRYIIERYEEEHSSEKVKLIIHDLSQDLTIDEFRNLNKLNSHLIFVIRDPLKHALSMLLRYANDKLSEPGGDKLEAQDVLQLMQNPESLQAYCRKNPDKISLPLLHKLLEKPQDTALTDVDYRLAYKKVIEIFLEEFTISWDNMYQFFKVNQAEFPDHPYSIFDGSWLFDHPEDRLRALTQKIHGITFTPNMISPWTKGVGEKFHCVITRNWGVFAHTNAWNGPVRNSTGIVQQKKSAGSQKVGLESFPLELQAAIHERMPLYREMLSAAR